MDYSFSESRKGGSPLPPHAALRDAPPSGSSAGRGGPSGAAQGEEWLLLSPDPCAGLSGSLAALSLCVGGRFEGTRLCILREWHTLLFPRRRLSPAFPCVPASLRAAGNCPRSACPPGSESFPATAAGPTPATGSPRVFWGLQAKTQPMRPSAFKGLCRTILGWC